MSQVSLSLPFPFTPQKDRFIVESLEVGFAVYDSRRSQPKNLNGFFCVSTFDLQLNAFRFAGEANDEQDDVL